MDGENQLNIKNVSLLGSPEEIEENFNAIIDRFTTTPKVIQGEMASIYESFDADYLQTYIDTANDAINIGLVKDEKNIERMKKIISEIENMSWDKESQSSDKQIQKKLKDFEEYYLKFSNEIKGLSKETLKSIMESAMGMADQYENALQSVDAKIVDFIKRVQTQNIVEGLTEITSSIFMINSMISSIRQLPRI